MSRHHASSLKELRRIPKQDESISWHLRIIESELNGGKQTKANLDAIAASPDASALTVSGLDQATLEYLVQHYGAQFTAFHFWKCPRIADLSPLEDLPQLTHVSFFWNQRATRLWDFRKSSNLKGLHFDDFTRLPQLDDLANATSLSELGFGNAIWSKFEVETLEPLSFLRQLKALAFDAKRILDGRVQPLAALHNLETLEFPSKLFSTEQLCWLRARLPDSVAGASLGAIRNLSRPLSMKGKNLDILVNGKGKPFLDSKMDSARLEKFVATFDQMVERFLAEPDLEPTQ